MCQHVTPYFSCMREIRQERRKARSPAQHTPAVPDGGYCCHDAALQLSRLPTLAGGGIRFGLVRSDDQPRRRNMMGSRQAGGLARGRRRPGPGPCRWAESTRLACMRSTRYMLSGLYVHWTGYCCRTNPGKYPIGTDDDQLAERGGEVEMDVRKAPCPGGGDREREREAGS